MWQPATTLEKKAAVNAKMISGQRERPSSLDTHTSGRITDQSTLSTLQSTGIRFVVRMATPMRAPKERTKASQKRLRIRGTSMKKLDRSTSFFVAPQVMLYEKRWASKATERCMDIPPKKKKLNMVAGQVFCLRW